MDEMTKIILLLSFAVVWLVLGILNLKGKLVDIVYARRDDERAKDKGQKLARALGYFTVSLFLIWRAFRNFDNEFLKMLVNIIMPMIAAGVLVPPVVEWIKNRKSKVIMVQIIVMAVVISSLFLFMLFPLQGASEDFTVFFHAALLMVFLVICIYTPRRYGLTIAIVLGMMIPIVLSVDPYPYEILVKVLGLLTGVAAAYGLDFLISRNFSKSL